MKRTIHNHNFYWILNKNLQKHYAKNCKTWTFVAWPKLWDSWNTLKFTETTAKRAKRAKLRLTTLSSWSTRTPRCSTRMSVAGLWLPILTTSWSRGSHRRLDDPCEMKAAGTSSVESWGPATWTRRWPPRAKPHAGLTIGWRCNKDLEKKKIADSSYWHWTIYKNPISQNSRILVKCKSEIRFLFG